MKEPGNSHVASLFIITCWLVFVPKLFREPSTRNFVIAGVLFGLTSLIRPTNPIAILYLLFAPMEGPNGGNWKDRWHFLIDNLKKIPVAALALLLVWFPQIMVLAFHYRQMAVLLLRRGGFHQLAFA